MTTELRRLGNRGWLNADDLPAIGTSRRAILECLSDGEYHSTTELDRVGNTSRSGARVYDLRQAGFYIVSERRGEPRVAWYRLIAKGDPPVKAQPPHAWACPSCRCQPEQPPEGQLAMPIGRTT